MLFKLGQLTMTPGAKEFMISKGINFNSLLDRHARGDWGDLEKEDLEQNDFGVSNGDRIFSSYNISEGDKIWIITEADRSVTTILLPEEY